ncbi:MAG: DUF1573 domain-containing protein [Cyclobacteriaceae bacterium]|nr:DUF1573 domain-containing protein [Cyclobacteriaceae bacterium]
MIIVKPILKRIWILLLFLSVQAIGQEIQGPRIDFEEESYDFGDIEQGNKTEHVFSFKNSGTQPLVISNILTTCGCTAPTWPKEPVAPGENGEIKVVFNSTGKMGKQNKVITIFSNSVNQKDRITIQANIIPGY